MARHQKNRVWSSEAKQEKIKRVGEKQRKTRRWRGRDRVSGQTWAVLLGHSSTHGLSARLKATLGFKREPWRFFSFSFFYCLQKHIYLFLAVPAPLALPLESCSMTPARVPSPLYFFSPFFFSFYPPSSFNTTAVENQTALKQIDVLFNIVVTSSQGPRASASVTTAGLLSLARRWLPLCWSLQWFITKKSGRRKERRGERKKKTRETERKVPWIMIESLAPLIDKV